MTDTEESDLPRFVIVNEADRPSMDHIAQDMGDGTCRYIHPRLRHWEPLDLGRATDLKDFGFVMNWDNREKTRVEFNRWHESKATYKADGKIRQWQDEHEQFVLGIWVKERKSVA